MGPPTSRFLHTIAFTKKNQSICVHNRWRLPSLWIFLESLTCFLGHKKRPHHAPPIFCRFGCLWGKPPRILKDSGVLKRHLPRCSSNRGNKIFSLKTSGPRNISNFARPKLFSDMFILSFMLPWKIEWFCTSTMALF